MAPLQQQVVRRIRQLLSQGMSYRQIQTVTGAGRGSIERIANGEHRSSAVQFSEDQPERFQNVRPYRCPCCNKTVTTAPCVACAAKRGQ